MITVNSILKASIQKVWQCWTNSEHITQWNFASDDWCCPKATNDLKVGGRFSWRMEAKDGSMGFDFEGTFTEVIQNQKISYVMDDDRKVEVLFERIEGEVLVTESFDPETQNSEELQRQGWQAILDNFKKYVEGK